MCCFPIMYCVLLPMQGPGVKAGGESGDRVHAAGVCHPARVLRAPTPGHRAGAAPPH